MGSRCFRYWNKYYHFYVWHHVYFCFLPLLLGPKKIMSSYHFPIKVKGSYYSSWFKRIMDQWDTAPRSYDFWVPWNSLPSGVFVLSLNNQPYSKASHFVYFHLNCSSHIRPNHGCDRIMDFLHQLPTSVRNTLIWLVFIYKESWTFYYSLNCPNKKALQ